jgi:hypothetical protein
MLIPFYFNLKFYVFSSELQHDMVISIVSHHLAIVDVGHTVTSSLFTTHCYVNFNSNCVLS